MLSLNNLITEVKDTHYRKGICVFLSDISHNRSVVAKWHKKGFYPHGRKPKMLYKICKRLKLFFCWLLSHSHLFLLFLFDLLQLVLQLAVVTAITNSML